jgi:hypothetical protein
MRRVKPPGRAAWLAALLIVMPAVGAAGIPPPRTQIDAQPQPVPAELAASGAGSDAAGTGGLTTGQPGGSDGSAGSRPAQSRSNADLPGPYDVKQTKRLGREVLAGRVCTLADEFQVTFETPMVTFKMRFAPQAVSTRSSPLSPTQGTWSYAYALARAGEAHDAVGDFDIAQDVPARRLHVTVRGKDHVTFKGHDGLHTIEYGFDLVPTPGTPCP